MQLKLKNQKILYASYYIRHCEALKGLSDH
jgi:hypothetical protein